MVSTQLLNSVLVGYEKLLMQRFVIVLSAEGSGRCYLHILTLNNFSYPTRTEFNNCFIIYLHLYRTQNKRSSWFWYGNTKDSKMTYKYAERDVFSFSIQLISSGIHLDYIRENKRGAGLKMTTSCVPCKAKMRNFISSLEEWCSPDSCSQGKVTRRVWDDNCCKYSNNIEVVNCGAFHVYKLSRPSGGCNSRDNI